MVNSGTVVLVVDDDPDVRETIVSVLKPRGFTVVDAANGRQALEILEHDPTIEILFTDVMMPGISGITLAKRAMELRPRLKVVLTSAYMREGGIDLTLPVLQKPFLADQLVRILLDSVRA